MFFKIKKNCYVRVFNKNIAITCKTKVVNLLPDKSDYANFVYVVL